MESFCCNRIPSSDWMYGTVQREIGSRSDWVRRWLGCLWCGFFPSVFSAVLSALCWGRLPFRVRIAAFIPGFKSTCHITQEERGAGLGKLSLEQEHSPCPEASGWPPLKSFLCWVCAVLNQFLKTHTLINMNASLCQSLNIVKLLVVQAFQNSNFCLKGKMLTVATNKSVIFLKVTGLLRLFLRKYLLNTKVSATVVGWSVFLSSNSSAPRKTRSAQIMIQTAA